MPLALLGVLFTVAGFVMLVLEVVRVLTGAVLGSIGTILLWTGFGLLAAGLVLLVVSLLVRDQTAGTELGGTEVSDEAEEPVAEVVEPVTTPRKKASAPASRRRPADKPPAPRPRARRAAGQAPAATTEDPPSSP